MIYGRYRQFLREDKMNVLKSISSVYKRAAGEVISTQSQRHQIGNCSDRPEFSVEQITARKALLGKGYKVHLIESMDPGFSNAEGPAVNKFYIGTFSRAQALKLQDLHPLKLTTVAQGESFFSKYRSMRASGEKLVRGNYNEQFSDLEDGLPAPQREEIYRRNVTNFLTSHS